MRNYLPIFWLLLLFISGCASLSTPDQAAQPPSELLDFEDVPIPSGFRKDAKESLIFETRAFRVGVLVYQGKAETASLVEFFKTGLTTQGWKLLASFQGPNAVMVFSKEKKSCLITISQGTWGSRVEVKVGALVEPLAPVPSP